MKIFDAIYTATIFLQLDELADGMNADGFDRYNYASCLSDEAATELGLLLRCCNLVLDELSAGDFPLKTQGKFTPRNGKIDYALFPQKVTRVYAAERNGKRLPIEVFYDGIAVPGDSACTVTYAYTPPTVTLAANSPYGGNIPGARLLAYGIAREYCLISGMTEDASVWDARFVAAVQDEAYPCREKRVLARKWA